MTLGQGPEIRAVPRGTEGQRSRDLRQKTKARCQHGGSFGETRAGLRLSRRWAARPVKLGKSLRLLADRSPGDCRSPARSGKGCTGQVEEPWDPMSLENGESPPTAEPTAQEPRRSRAMTAAPTSGCLLHPEVSAAEYGTGQRGLRAPRPGRLCDLPGRPADHCLALVATTRPPSEPHRSSAQLPRPPGPCRRTRPACPRLLLPTS
jgi:hypothetical protein